MSQEEEEDFIRLSKGEEISPPFPLFAERKGDFSSFSREKGRGRGGGEGLQQTQYGTRGGSGLF